MAYPVRCYRDLPLPPSLAQAVHLATQLERELAVRTIYTETFGAQTHDHTAKSISGILII